MKNFKKNILFLLLPTLSIISTSLPLYSCSSKNDDFDNLYYGSKTPEINKKNRKKVMDIAAKHFEEQWSIIEYGSTISISEFNEKIKTKTIVCDEYYWNFVYYFANICSDKNVYQIIDWGNNKRDAKTITSNIVLRYNDIDRTLHANESNVFEYNYDISGNILITLANDNLYAIPSYVASYIKVTI